MKKVIIISFLGALVYAGSGCQDETVSYLDVSAMEYPKNSMTIINSLTPADTAISKPGGAPWLPPSYPYKTRIKNNAPWVSLGFWGGTVEGARPLIVTLEKVEVKGDKTNADILKQELKIVGEGRLEIPLYTRIPVGEYLLSFRIANISGSDVVNNAFTIIVTDDKTPK